MIPVHKEICPMCGRFVEIDGGVIAIHKSCLWTVMCRSSGCKYQAYCMNCDKPATCYGTYENCTGYACDDCCGHGCEDGRCDKINEE